MHGRIQLLLSEVVGSAKTSRPDRLLASTPGMLGGESNSGKFDVVASMGGISCSTWVSLSRASI